MSLISTVVYTIMIYQCLYTIFYTVIISKCLCPILYKLMPLSPAWQPVHHDRQIVPAVQSDNVVPCDLKFSLPPDINAHVFTKFVSVYFKVSIPLLVAGL